MGKMIRTALLTLLFIPCFLVSQTLFEFIYNEIPGVACGTDVIQDSQGNYLMVGSLDGDLLIAKSNMNGNLLWYKTYGNASTEEIACSVLEIGSGGYLISAYKNGLWIMNVDFQGDTIWTKSYHDLSEGAVCSQTDSTFLFVGGSPNPNNIQFEPASGSDIYSLEISNNGNEIQQMMYELEYDEKGLAVSKIDDGNIMIAWPGIVLRTNEDGDTLWTRKDVIGYDVMASRDGNYAIFGEMTVQIGTSPLDVAGSITKLNQNNEIIWTWSSEGSSLSICTKGIETQTGDYISILKDYQENKNYLVCISSAGNLLWKKEMNYSLTSISNCSDNCYVCTGSIDGDLFLIKNEVELSVNDLVHSNHFLTVSSYPNPFNPMTTLEYALPMQSDINCTIYDLSGNKVKTYSMTQSPGNHSMVWNASELSSGIYLVKFTAEAVNGSQTFVDYQKITLLK